MLTSRIVLVTKHCSCLALNERLVEDIKITITCVDVSEGEEGFVAAIGHTRLLPWMQQKAHIEKQPRNNGVKDADFAYGMCPRII